MLFPQGTVCLLESCSTVPFDDMKERQEHYCSVSYLEHLERQEEKQCRDGRKAMLKYGGDRVSKYILGNPEPQKQMEQWRRFHIYMPSLYKGISASSLQWSQKPEWPVPVALALQRPGKQGEDMARRDHPS